MHFARAKVQPPRATPFAIERDRLMAQPFPSGNARVVTLSAPAGSGKTTLLRQWYEAHARAGVRTAWISLDPGDDAPQRLLALFESAFGIAARADISVATVRFAERLREIFGTVIDDGTPAVVFLDDAHVLADRGVLDDLAVTLEALPDRISVVLAGRYEPPLALSRLRLRGSVASLGWSDVAFTGGEAARFFEEARLELTAAERSALVVRGEGWIAGLALAALSLRDGMSPQRVIERLTGERGDIAAYFLENVFAHQSSERRAFLLDTAILDRLRPELCDAVRDRADSKTLLDELASDNVFVVETGGGWYRYHHLFAEFLVARLERERPGARDALHVRASRWFESDRDWPVAIEHALRGHERARALELARSRGLALFRRAAFRELDELLARLPPEDVRDNASLLMLRVWARAYAGDVAGASDDLAAVAALEPLGDYAAEAAVARAIVEVIRCDEPATAPSAAVTQIVARDPVISGFAAIARGYAARAAGDFAGALAAFRDAARSGANAASLVYLLARFNVGGMFVLAGKPAEAEAELRDALAEAERRRWFGGLGIAFVRVQLANALADRNRLEEAGRELERAIIALRGGGAYGFLGVALAERARVAFASGNAEQGREDAREAREIARTHGLERAAFRAGLVEFADVLWRDRARAETVLNGLFAAFAPDAIRTDAPASERLESLLAARAAALVASGRSAEALRIVRERVEGAVAAGRTRNAAIFLATSAVAWDALGDRSRAIEKLDQALSVAPGSVRLFTYAGPRLVPLLETLAASGRRSAEATAVLELFGRGSTTSRRTRAQPRDAATEVGSELRPREREILLLIAQGRRDPEIALQLGISRETVKWYVKGMFAKLDVRTRAQAIASGRRLGLFE